jgi:hypothetical protein
LKGFIEDIYPKEEVVKKEDIKKDVKNSEISELKMEKNQAKMNNMLQYNYLKKLVGTTPQDLQLVIAVVALKYSGLFQHAAEKQLNYHDSIGGGASEVHAGGE